jgi:hypothetical protein
MCPVAHKMMPISTSSTMISMMLTSPERGVPPRRAVVVPLYHAGEAANLDLPVPT